MKHQNNYGYVALYEIKYHCYFMIKLNFLQITVMITITITYKIL